jgi:NAD(P)H-dependent FMN reductase
MAINVVGVGGSLRPGSQSEQALRIALAGAADAGARTTALTGERLVVPFYDIAIDERTDRARDLVEAIRGADGLIVVSPGYHGGPSGLVKNALDYVEDLHHDHRPYLSGRAVGIVAVAGVIALVESRFQADRLPQVIRFGVLVGFTNTCLALIALTLLGHEPMALWLLVLPALLLYSAYRAYSSERQKHASLQFLYQATRILHGSRELDTAVTDLLGLAQKVFRAEAAEICFFAPDGTAHGFRARSESGEVDDPATRFTLALDDPLRARAIAVNKPFFYQPETSDEVETHGLRNGMVALLQGETEPLGMIVVGNRLGEVGGFTDDDMLL